MRHATPALAALLLLLPACGDLAPLPPIDAADATSDTATAPDTTAPSALAYAPCPDATRIGRFTLARDLELTTIDGRVHSGVVPANIREVALADGPCRVLVGRSLFCDPACGAGETCGEGGTCIPYPTAQDVGEVSVSGLSVPLVLTSSSSHFYSNGATTLPHPAWEDGDRLTLTAPGGALTPFTLEGRGVPVLDVPTAAIPVARDAATTITWTPPTAAGDARIQILFDLAHHGGIAASIVCDDLPDNGTYTVPAALVTRLLDEGVAGFPLVTVTRQTVDSTTLAAGCVELRVTAAVSRDVLVPGLVSCADDDGCTPPATCPDDLPRQ